MGGWCKSISILYERTRRRRLKKNIKARRQGALDRLLKVKEPNKKQQDEIAVLEQKVKL